MARESEPMENLKKYRKSGLEHFIKFVRELPVIPPKKIFAKLEEAAKRNQWRFTRLGLDYAFHSAVLDPIRGDLIAELGDVRGGKSGERFVSTVTGAPLDGRQLDAEYWWRNIRDPVQFKPAIDHIAADGVRIFVEIGPNPADESQK